MSCPVCGRPIEATDTKCIHCGKSFTVDIYVPPEDGERFQPYMLYKFYKLHKLKSLLGYYALCLVLAPIITSILYVIFLFIDFAITLVLFQVIEFPNFELMVLIEMIKYDLPVALVIFTIYWIKEELFEIYE